MSLNILKALQCLIMLLLSIKRLILWGNLYRLARMEYLDNISFHWSFTAWKMSVFGVILVQMRENTDQNNSENGHFSGSVFQYKIYFWLHLKIILSRLSGMFFITEIFLLQIKHASQMHLPGMTFFAISLHHPDGGEGGKRDASAQMLVYRRT